MEKEDQGGNWLSQVYLEKVAVETVHVYVLV